MVSWSSPRILETYSSGRASDNFSLSLTYWEISLSFNLFIKRFDAEVAPLPTKISASFSVAFKYCLMACRASSLAKTDYLPLADCILCVLAYSGIILSLR